MPHPPLIFSQSDYCYKFTYLMANSADPDQLASTVCKGRVYLGSAGQGLIQSVLHCNRFDYVFLLFPHHKTATLCTH